MPEEVAVVVKIQKIPPEYWSIPVLAPEGEIGVSPQGKGEKNHHNKGGDNYGKGLFISLHSAWYDAVLFHTLTHPVFTRPMCTKEGTMAEPLINILPASSISF